MKKFLLIICCTFLFASYNFSQELIKGGNMQDASAWNFYYNSKDAPDTMGFHQFNYTADKPAAGKGGCYRISTYGQSATFLWQPVTITPGHKYSFTGAFKNATVDSIKNTWVEFILTRSKPTGGEVQPGDGDFRYSFNTWETWGIKGGIDLKVDGTFQDNSKMDASLTSSILTIEDTVTTTQWYIVIKAGCWNKLADKKPTFDLLFDEISLKDISPELVKGGNMEDASAWNFYYNSKDAPDTMGTHQFNYTADKPAAGKGGCYRVSTYGQSATFLWQPVTVTPGHKYLFTGAFKNATVDSIKNTWVELILTRSKPTGGEVQPGDGDFRYSFNTWETWGTKGGIDLRVDGTFQNNAKMDASLTSSLLTIADTATTTQWYIVIKAGCWNKLADKKPTFDLLFDEISLRDLSVSNSGGNMEDASAWNFYYNYKDAPDTMGFHQFNYTADKPAAGSGGCYRVSSYGQTATFLWQPVPVIPGHRYSLTGAFKNATKDSIKNAWVELILTKDKPTGGEVQPGDFGYRYSFNTWETWGKKGGIDLKVDGTFQDNAKKDALLTSSTLVIPDTVASKQWYIVIKAGSWNILGKDTMRFDLLFDEIQLNDLGLEPWITLPVEKVVVGKVDSPADFTGSVRMKYDADSVHMVFNAVDDSIVTKGNAYQVDNIEIYFDMQNTKNIHYPRNGGWLKSIDDAYDSTDYQLRLVPGVSFGKNNKARPSSASIDSTGCKQVYTRTDNGYQIELNVAWKTLMRSFVPAAGKLIGFDVLWSDNDAVASDANRNQITWNSPTDKPFNDPSLFGVLQLTPSGSFIPVLDTEKPSMPANLVAVATGNSVLLTWDPSTDNRVVQSYIVFDKTTAVDTIYAVKTGNKFVFKDVVTGSHKFGVTAVDVYGNKSAKASTENIKVSVNELSNSRVKLYPNPTSGIVNILTDNNRPSKLSVYNVSGELVRSTEFTLSHTLDMSGNVKGIYFLHITSDGNTQISKLIVK